MARNKSTEIELTAYDDLFQTDESREEAKLSKIRDIPISEIDEFPDHPFKVLIDEDMEQLVESIKRNGVMTPATVRLKEDGRYELISGHRRRKACELAGLETLKCEVKDLSRDEAIAEWSFCNTERRRKYEALFRKCCHNSDHAYDPGTAGIYRLFHLPPCKYTVLGTPERYPAGIRSCDLLLCIGTGRSGQDHTAHHRWQLRTGTVPPHQHSYHRGLHWRIADYRCRHCHAHCKDAAGTPGLVLCHVRRCDAEDRDHGDRTDHPLRRKEHVLMPLVDPSRWTGAASAASHDHAAVQEIM